MFLGTDDPDRIVSLLDQYPWFENLYRDLYTACCNTEKVMDMFSEELRILDRNTAQYMIDEMEAEIRKQGEQLKEKDAQIEERDAQLEKKDAQIEADRGEGRADRRKRCQTAGKNESAGKPESYAGEGQPQSG